MSTARVPVETATCPTIAVNIASISTIRSKNEQPIRRKENWQLSLEDTNLVGISPAPARQRKQIDLVNEAATTEDVLSFMLGHVAEEPDAQDLTRSLLSRFGGVGAILVAKRDQIVEACAGREDCASLIRAAYLVMKRALREPLQERVTLGNTALLLDYLRLSMGHEKSESVRLLFLDQKNGLILDEEHSRGTVNHVPVYPREVVRRVLDVHATGLIIVHNHPSGDPTPSNEDVAMTRTLKRILSDMGVQLHDHVVVGRARSDSMRLLGLI